MSFDKLWPICFLLFIPVIILIYMLKQKAKKVEISSNMLWKEVYKNLEATTPWEKLKFQWLMVLQIILIILFVLSLMSPFILSGSKKTSSLIIVIDNSASMNALYDEDTRLEQAKKNALEYLDTIPENTKVTLIECNNQATVLATNEDNIMTLKSKIKQIESTYATGDLSLSANLVNSIMAQQPDANIVYYTDSQFQNAYEKSNIYSLYKEKENVSVDYVSYGMADDKITVITKITNGSSDGITTDVTLYEQETDRILGMETLTLDAMSSEVVYFEGIETDSDKVYVKSSKKDMLMEDNIGYLVLKKQMGMKVLLISDGNVFLEKALASVEGLDVYKTQEITNAEGLEEYDLYILDGKNMDNIPEDKSILFIHSQNNEYVSAKETGTSVSLKLTSSEITNYIDGFSFGVMETDLYQVPTWAESFISTGETSAGYYGEYNGRKIAVIGFDFHQSDFALQAEFPILMYQMTQYLLQQGMLSQNSYQPCESVELKNIKAGVELEIMNPKGNSETYTSNGNYISYEKTDELGFYELNDGSETASFSVSYPTESESYVVPAVTQVAETGFVVKLAQGMVQLRNKIIYIMLALLLLEWLVYKKTK
ncbi:MAG: BatA and WFA domain-containing protein [Lachnospiraceae bacterium]|nr:BatA and WFA domain-containing protein [Lachnospiraceae bacterium]